MFTPIPDLDFSIPDPDPHRRHDKEFKYFLTQKLFTKLSKILSEMFIPNADIIPSRIRV
jgi:hypothetical protein